eukprot:TRINITY_DN89955_c0_g1_i1.p1 TRINITY_DN89955_c0_g1~~TRINITY_DN89955_c0_g1_i1.p1  ORF type:complete len:460 (-),score=59.72 TRINITY_DN89955_c0_g1_i1:219-1598(-)
MYDPSTGHRLTPDRSSVVAQGLYHLRGTSDRTTRNSSQGPQRASSQARQSVSEPRNYSSRPVASPDHGDGLQSPDFGRRRTSSQRRNIPGEMPRPVSNAERSVSSGRAPTPTNLAPCRDMQNVPNVGRAVSRSRVASPLLPDSESAIHDVRTPSKQTARPAGLPRAPVPGAARNTQSRPGTDTSARCEPKLEFFTAGLQGLRPYMEDRTLVVPSVQGHQGVSLFAVFDGHGGAGVAELATKMLPELISETLSRCKLPEAALRECFAQLDKSLLNIHASADQDFHRVGSTANVCLIISRAGRMRVFCANCGDSRAVLSRAGVAIDLSKDHAPQNPGEERRIEAAGGQVVICDSIGRVDGGLAVSRALGDFKYKARTDLAPEKQKVIAVPDIKEITVGECDEFVVIGSDGIFSVFSSEELVSMLGFARQRGETWKDAIQDALVKATAGGDNVCLCVAQFVH